MNNKIYIGARQHKTPFSDTKYMGSGKHLALAKKKYGIENFHKEILFIFDNQKSMYDKENDLVNETFVSRLDTYNMKLGGFSACGHKHTEETKKKISEKRKSCSAPNKGVPMSEEQKLKISSKLKGKKIKPRTEEHKNKINESLKRYYELKRLSVQD